jgi:Protein of unknown function (DUF1761)
VAAVVVFVLGWLWYSPLLFLKPWMRLRGMDPVAAMAGATMPAGKLLIESGRCLVLAYVIARLVAMLGVNRWMGAVQLGLFLWIGFPAILLTRAVLWENIPWRVAAIHAGDRLVKPVIVSVWHLETETPRRRATFAKAFCAPSAIAAGQVREQYLYAAVRPTGGGTVAA